MQCINYSRGVGFDTSTIYKIVLYSSLYRKRTKLWTAYTNKAIFKCVPLHYTNYEEIYDTVCGITTLVDPPTIKEPMIKFLYLDETAQPTMATNNFPIVHANEITYTFMCVNNTAYHVYDELKIDGFTPPRRNCLVETRLLVMGSVDKLKRVSHNFPLILYSNYLDDLTSTTRNYESLDLLNNTNCIIAQYPIHQDVHDCNF